MIVYLLLTAFNLTLCEEALESSYFVWKCVFLVFCKLPICVNVMFQYKMCKR